MLRGTIATILQADLPVIPVIWYQHTTTYSARISNVSIDPLELSYRIDQMQKVNADKAVVAIQSLRLPTLIIWGGKDRLIPVENAHRFATDVVGSRLVVFDALGHVPHEEEPDATVRAVRSFLDASL